MEILITILLFLLGLILIVKGGDFFVDASTWIAEISGIPKFLIGATIVSFATTLPELLVSLMAAFAGSTGIAVGNAVGSVTANLGLIMGISAVCLPAVIDRKEHGINLVLMLAAILLLAASSFSGSLHLLGAWLLLILFAIYTFLSIRSARQHMGNTDEPRPERTRQATLSNCVKFVLGIAGIVGGAQLMVDYGTDLARLLGVPEAVIGATLVAVGTSLPELITTLTALAKKQASLSIGNIVGANIIDLTVILPLCAVFSGQALPVLRQNLILDMPFCLMLVLLAIIPPLATGKFHKKQGIVMLLTYGVYIALLCVQPF